MKRKKMLPAVINSIRYRILCIKAIFLTYKLRRWFKKEFICKEGFAGATVAKTKTSPKYRQFAGRIVVAGITDNTLKGFEKNIKRYFSNYKVALTSSPILYWRAKPKFCVSVDPSGRGFSVSFYTRFYL